MTPPWWHFHPEPGRDTLHWIDNATQELDRMSTALAAERAEVGRLKAERDRYKLLNSEASTSLTEARSERWWSDVAAAEAKHTPGPWRVRAENGLWWTIEAELPSINGLPCWYTVARCDFDRAADGYTDGALNPEADAHLIARAPELATALAAERAEVGRLNVALHNTREAAESWRHERDEARAECKRLWAARDEDT